MSSPESWPKVWKVPKEYPTKDGERIKTQDGKDLRNTSTDVVREALKLAFPDREVKEDWSRFSLDEVGIKPVDKPWSYHGPKRKWLFGLPLGGIELRAKTPWQLRPSRGRANDPMRRVMVSKDGTLDLEALRSKHAELVKELAAMAERAKAKEKREADREGQVRAAQERLGLPTRYAWDSPVRAYFAGNRGVRYKVELSGVVETDAKDLVAFLKERGLWPKEVRE